MTDSEAEKDAYGILLNEDQLNEKTQYRFDDLLMNFLTKDNEENEESIADCVSEKNRDLRQEIEKNRLELFEEVLKPNSSSILSFDQDHRLQQNKTEDDYAIKEKVDTSYCALQTSLNEWDRLMSVEIVRLENLKAEQHERIDSINNNAATLIQKNWKRFK
ncbi:hypothetical protein Ciccas_003187 [Cichlidogyrus casuarinus]|uniref:Uncharacterized protein n=1 Tax=Cichlidogyrus casuarinus TaxID=1844966 RepID=A0ABD2QF65_9PLAT